MNSSRGLAGSRASLTSVGVGDGDVLGEGVGVGDGGVGQPGGVGKPGGSGGRPGSVGIGNDGIAGIPGRTGTPGRSGSAGSAGAAAGRAMSRQDSLSDGSNALCARFSPSLSKKSASPAPAGTGAANPDVPRLAISLVTAKVAG